MLILYWQIGKTILDKQEKEGWGTKIIDRLSQDLKLEFDTIKGFSSRNLKYMRLFATEYPYFEELINRPLSKKDANTIMHQLGAQLPWRHNILLIEKLKDIEKRLWYAQQTIENGWSRTVLDHQIGWDLYKRQAIEENKMDNLKETLPALQSDLVRESLKDEYKFDFLSLTKEHSEKELEDGLVQNIIQFILELGKGFAFVGRQYKFSVGGDEFFVDLLFYHLKLRCYVAIDLKTKSFQPEHVGKMSFYLSCIDDSMKNEHDNPSVGIILCKESNKEVKKKSVSTSSRPIAVSVYTLSDELPDELKILKEAEKFLE